MLSDACGLKTFPNVCKIFRRRCTAFGHLWIEDVFKERMSSKHTEDESLLSNASTNKTVSKETMLKGKFEDDNMLLDASGEDIFPKGLGKHFDCAQE